MWNKDNLAVAICVCVCLLRSRIWEYGHEDPLRWPHDTLYPQVGANFADNRRSLGQYSVLTN
jgi:hypothetical protein